MNDISQLVSAARNPPKVIEAEQVLLGSLMLDSNKIGHIVDLLTPDNFFDNLNRKIFEAIVKCHESGMEVIDAVVVVEYMKDTSEVSLRDLVHYLTSLVEAVPTSAAVDAYATLIAEAARKREIINVAVNMLVEASSGPDVKVSSLIADSENSLMRIAAQDAGSKQGFVHIKDALSPVFDGIGERFESESEMQGLTSGLADLDEMTRGFMPGQLIIVAARPGMGKTAFSLKLSIACALYAKQAVGYFSLEMSTESLVTRTLASVGRVDQDKIKTGNLNDHDWSRLTNAVAELHRAELFIDDTASVTMAQIRAKARKLAASLKAAGKKLGLIVVDYLQLIAAVGGKDKKANRNEEISEISRTLKLLAKELKVPVVALAQLNRDVEKRKENKGRPVLTDLRESGSIEQDADLVMFLYRDEYYDPDSQAKGLAEIIVGKQRDGSTGTVIAGFNGAYGRFDDHTLPGMGDSNEYGYSR